MKVAVLTSLLYHECEEISGKDRIIWGGAEKYLFKFCKLLQSMNIDVTVYQSLNQVGPDGKRVPSGNIQKNFNGIPVICLSDTDEGWSYSTNPRLNMVFNEMSIHYDLLVFFATFLCFPYVPNNSISISHGIFWDYPQHFIANCKPEDKAEFMRRQLYGFTAPDVCVAVDSNVRKVIAAMEPGAERNINVIYNFVDTKAFHPVEKTWEGIKVLYPRRLTTLRGCNDFIKASQDYPDYNYLAVGQAGDERVEMVAGKWAEGASNIKFTWQPMEEMPEIYQQADIGVVPTKASEGLSLSCLPPGTEIIMENGRARNIEDVIVGDMVLTHTGNYQKVTETMNRKADKLYKIKIGGGFGTTVEMTGEHPVLAYKPPKHKNGWACRPGCRTHPLQSRKYWDKAKPQWYHAKDIDRGDVVVFPKVKNKPWDDLTIDLAEFLTGDNWFFDKTHVWNKFGNSKANVRAREIAKELGVSIHTVYNATHLSAEPSFRWDVDKTKVGSVIKYLEENDIELTNKFPRYLKIDKDFMRLLGFYVAEGYSKKGVIGFCFHAKETEYHADVIALMKKYFDADANLSIDGNKAKIIFCGNVIEEVLAGFVGYGSRNKVLPEGVMTASDDCVIEFLKGLWAGDGHVRGKPAIAAQYVSASRNLIQQVHLLLTRFGIFSSIYKRKHVRQGCGVSYTWELALSGEGAYDLIDMLGFSTKYPERKRNSHRQYFEHGDFFCGVIGSIETIDYDGQVYNIEVENDNSYVANNIVVHNCLEVMATGLPVVTTPVGGIGDAVIPNYNALIYDPNHGGLGECIDFLAKNPDVREKMGKLNREIAVQSFDIEIWRERWRRLIKGFGG